MKNLYGKSKGKIHPDGVGGSGTSSAALQAALAILPAAILALSAALSPEDREVLAYLVARSLRGGAAPVEEPQPQPLRWRSSKGKGNAGGAHHHQQQQQQQKHGFECGCFDCYRGFWCRWDTSPDREVIHQAIEAFEEHLASGEMEMASKGGRRRGAKGKNKGKGAKGSTAVVAAEGANGKVGKGAGEKTTADSKKKNEADEKQLATEHQPHVPSNVEEASAPVLAFPATSALDLDGAADPVLLLSPPPMEPATDVVPMQQHRPEEDHDEEVYYRGGAEDWETQSQPSSTSSCSVAAANCTLRRRGGGWADVMGLFNSRLWSLWSPGA